MTRSKVVAKLLSLRPLAFKSKFLLMFEFLKTLQGFVWKMLLVSKVCSPAIFSIQILQISEKFNLP